MSQTQRIIGGSMAQAPLDSKRQKKSLCICKLTGIKSLPGSNQRFQEDLIAQLRTRREFLKISQVELGEKVGVTESLLAKWETGHRRPSGFLLWCWAESLNVKLVLEVTNG